MLSRNFCAFINQALSAVSLVVLAAMAAAPADAASQYTRLQRTTVAHMAYAPAMRSRNGLPATVMDSFVRNAGSRADAIYGDEGQGENPPPFKSFTAAHRINAGIRGQQDAGLTTGHGSMLPDAWGRDEYLGLESSQSGTNNGAYDNISTPAIAPSFNNLVETPPDAIAYRRSLVGTAAGANGATNAAYSTYGSSAASSADSGF